MRDTYDKGMLNLFKNVFLVFNVVYVLAFYDLALLHSLDRILHSLVGLHPTDSHVSKGT